MQTTSNKFDTSRAHVTWYRLIASRVFHAAVESRTHSYIRTGKAVCGIRIDRASHTTDANRPNTRTGRTCKACERALAATITR